MPELKINTKVKCNRIILFTAILLLSVMAVITAKTILRLSEVQCDLNTLKIEMNILNAQKNTPEN